MGALQGKKAGVRGKVIHPNSRRAKQLQRVELRTKKLVVQKKVQRNGENARGRLLSPPQLFAFFSHLPRSAFSVDRHLYFVHALPDERTSVSLEELHQILVDYIHRNDSEIEELQKERETRAWRKAEGKGKREIELEKERDEDESEYRSGFGKSFPLSPPFSSQS